MPLRLLTLLSIWSAGPVFGAHVPILSSGPEAGMPRAAFQALHSHELEGQDFPRPIPHMSIGSDRNTRLAEGDDFHGKLARRGKIVSASDGKWASLRGGKSVQKTSQQDTASSSQRGPYQKPAERLAHKVLWFRIVGRDAHFHRVVPQLSHSFYLSSRKGVPVPPSTAYMGPLSYRLPKSHSGWECVTPAKRNKYVGSRFSGMGAGLAIGEQRQIMEEISTLGNDGIAVSTEEKTVIALYLTRFKRPAETGHASGSGLGMAY